MADTPDVIDLDAIAEQNAQARAELMEAVDALSAEQRREVWFGEWSLHDVIAHIAAWQDGFAHALELLARGERPVIPGAQGDDFDAFNAASTEARKDLGWEQLMAELSTARQRHEAAVRGLSALAPERLAPGKTANNLSDEAEHDREHVGAILAWRREKGY